MKSLKTYVVLENHLQVKRKYSKHDPIHVGANAPVRNKILGFIAEKGSCSSDDLKQFIKSANEESGKTTDMSWFTRNSRYVTVTEKEGVKTYKLSKLGERVVKATTVNEGKVNEGQDLKSLVNTIRDNVGNLDDEMEKACAGDEKRWKDYVKQSNEIMFALTTIKKLIK